MWHHSEKHEWALVTWPGHPAAVVWGTRQTHLTLVGVWLGSGLSTENLDNGSMIPPLGIYH